MHVMEKDLVFHQQGLAVKHHTTRLAAKRHNLPLSSSLLVGGTSSSSSLTLTGDLTANLARLLTEFRVVMASVTDQMTGRPLGFPTNI